MVVDLGYWTKVIRRLGIFLFSIIGIYLAFKLAVFYMPFLIAFIISLLMEPAIRYMMRKWKLHRRTSSIIIFVLVFLIIVGALTWGITTLISEASNLLQGLNGYFDKATTLVQNITSGIHLDRVKIPEQVLNLVNSSATDFLGEVSIWFRSALNGFVAWITQIPTIATYFVITLLALYFICTDKIYMLDQLEHHFPEKWVKKLSIHLRSIIKSLGCYLKAEATLVLVSFIISLIGLYIIQFMGFSIHYPLLIALVIGFVDALPILGSGSAMIPWAIICAIDGNLQLAIAIMVLWAIMSVVRQFIEPRVVAGQIGIHPIFTLIAMYTGFKLIGILGMLIGPIVLIILKNIFSTMIDKGIGKAIFDR